MKLSELNVSQQGYINWSLRECLIYWGSQCLTSPSGEFEPGQIPTRFDGGPAFAGLVIEYGREKGFIAKKNYTLLSKGWKAATSQMKKG